MSPETAADPVRRGVGFVPPTRRTEKVSEVLAREIVHDIRGLPSGAKLPAEANMLQKYQVGRASLREALRLLEVQGLIVIRPGPGGGPVVASADSRNFARMAALYFHLGDATYRDLVEARLVMEPVMARLAAGRRDPGDLAQLEQFISSTPEATDQSAYFRHATDFHGLVSGMSGNPVLDLLVQSLKDLYTDRFQGVIFPVRDRQRVQDEHVEIARAIVKGNGAKAERLMREHMVEFMEHSGVRNPVLFYETIDWR